MFSRKIPTDEEWWMICPDLCAYPGKLSSSNSIYWQSDVSPILIYISSLMEPFLCRLAFGLKWHNLQRMICCNYCLLLLYSSATLLSLHDKLLYFHCERIDSSGHRVRFNLSPFYVHPINWSQVSLLQQGSVFSVLKAATFHEPLAAIGEDYTAYQILSRLYLANSRELGWDFQKYDYLATWMSKTKYIQIRADFK